MKNTTVRNLENTHARICQRFSQNPGIELEAIGKAIESGLNLNDIKDFVRKYINDATEQKWISLRDEVGLPASEIPETCLIEAK